MLNVRRFMPPRRRAPRVAVTPPLFRLGIVAWLGKHPVLERRRTRFGLWWGNRSPRERRLLIALSSTAILFLVITAIYRPLSSARARAVADIHTYEVLTAQLRIAGPELARLKAMERGQSPEIVSRSASGFGLAIARMDQQQGQIHLSLQDAEFTKLVEWLVQLESTTTLRAVSIRAVRRPTPGTVNAQVSLRM